jgi:hypothetical protein
MTQDKTQKALNLIKYCQLTTTVTLFKIEKSVELA